MSLNLVLSQEQSLRFVMTQELRQSITMLQYNAQELTEFLYEQILENPLVDLSSFHQRKEKRVVDNQMDIYSARPVTLLQHLRSQLSEMAVPSYLRKVVVCLIDSLNESGYLEETEEELAALLQVSHAEVEQSIEILQMLEPAGVGARSLQECLGLQLKRLQNRNTLAEQLVFHYFQEVARRDWRRLSQELHVKMSELQAAVDTILSLQPKPGLAYSQELPQYIIPDIRVEKVKDTYVVELQQSYIPKVKIHSDYRDLLAKSTERDVTTYLSDKYQHVNWILRSLEQRDRTLLQVMEAIVRRQEDFFQKGPSYIKPLSLKEIANELHIHESTVSRATRHKYVATPYGVVEMKSFFSYAIHSAAEEISTKRVKELVKGFIETENKRKPYSDQKLAGLLESSYGISLSRRTVAKYREQCNIPCAAHRKQIGS